MVRTNLIDSAQRFAMIAHDGQKYGTHPYSVHLLETYKVAEKFNLSEEIKVACFLHDTLEDTDTTYLELKFRFGINVAELVYSVTDEQGRDRAERKQKTYKKIVKNGMSAVFLKLCDRIANIENAIENNNSFLKMYLIEHESFKDGICVLGLESEPIWEYYLELISNIDLSKII